MMDNQCGTCKSKDLKWMTKHMLREHNNNGVFVRNEQ